jgi:hypothetical protein
MADDHGASGPPAPETIARGHEIDAYDTTSVISVPLLVVLFFVLAFGTVSVIFYFIFPSTVDPNAHPMVVEQNKRQVTDRFDDIPGPHLDNFRQLEGNSRSITSTESPTGNPPLYHPEDIRVNPVNTPSLFQSGWTSAAKTHARIPVDEAMDLALKNQGFPIVPLSATPVGPLDSSNSPTASNAGRGAATARATPPKLPSAPPEAKKPGEKQPPEGKKAPGGKK